MPIEVQSAEGFDVILRGARCAKTSSYRVATRRVRAWTTSMQRQRDSVGYYWKK